MKNNDLFPKSVFSMRKILGSLLDILIFIPLVGLSLVLVSVSIIIFAVLIILTAPLVIIVWNNMDRIDKFLRRK